MKPGAAQASSVTPTQKAAIDKGRGILGNDGGGELNIKGRDGQIRAKDTTAPSNDL